jgi:hypothetical protein
MTKCPLKSWLFNDLLMNPGMDKKVKECSRYIKIKSEKEFIPLYAQQNASTGVKDLQLLICLLTGKLKGEKHLQSRRYI